MVWVLRDVANATDYTCFGEPALVENVSNLDYAHGYIKTVLPTDINVQLVEVTSGASDVVLLDGWLTQCTGPTVGGNCSFQMYERAQELSKIRAGSAANAFTITIAASANVDTTLSTVLSGSGWTLGTTGTGFKVAGVQFVGMSVLDILKKIFGSLLLDGSNNPIARYFWFDSATHTVYFGESRTTWSASTLQFNTGKDVTRVDTQDSNLRAYDGVMVMGSTNSVFAIYPSGCTSQKVAVFTDSSLTTIAACAAHAQTKFNSMYGAKIFRPQMKMKPYKAIVSGVRIHAGDLVQVDGTLMMCVDAVWKLNAVTLGFNSRIPIDTEDDQILSAGTSAAASNVAWDGGSQQVGSSSSGKWPLYISDVTKVREFVLKMKLSKLKRMSSDNAAVTGASVGSSGTNLSVTGSRYSGISTAGFENNNTDMSCQGWAGNSTVTVSSTTWTEVIGSKSISYNMWTRHFAILTVSMIVIPDSSSGALLDIGIANADGTILYTIPAAVPYASGSTDYTRSTITVTVMLKSLSGYSSSPDNAFMVYARLQSGSPTIVFKGYTCSISQINKHDHPVTDATHTNPITDTTHTNPFTDNSQTHTANNTPVEVTTYPSTVVVKVNGTTVKSDGGGSEMLLDCGDVTDKLVNGENTIEVTSAGTGNVSALGEYTSYGA